jgi:GxxExxY protein
MTENELAKVVVDTAYHIHRTLGPGLLESVYQPVLVYGLRKRGLQVKSEVPVPVVWEEVKLEIGFKADIIVEGKLVLELKSVEKTSPVHKKQLLTYLKLTDCRLGLLINFGSELIKDGISRVVNGLEE